MNSEPWKFLGRESELRFIGEHIGGDEPRSVVVAGAAGVGKTRLAREALAAARRAGRPTRWAAGTSAAATIPLGAVAHLLPSLEPSSGPLAVLQRAGAALAEGDRESRLVVAIDDAHLLDELSMTLVHQLALTRAASLVLTVRADERAPDPVVGLWKDGLAERLELPRLARTDVDRLVSVVLGGPVDSRTKERLWHASKGNALFLRELVHGGCQTGRLRMHAGVWHWDGPLQPTPRLCEIVHAQLSALAHDEWAVLELLAVGEPIRLGRLTELTSTEVIATLERRGLVTVEHSGWRAQVRLSHPVHGTVVRDQLPATDARRIRGRLAACHLGEPGEVLRAGRLLVDSDEPQAHAKLLAEAAARANVALEHGLAARMVRAGTGSALGPGARIALLESVRWDGDPDLAEQVAVGEVAETGPVDAARLAVGRAVNLYFGLGKAAAADGLLEHAVTRAAGTSTVATVRAVRQVLALHAGRPQRPADDAGDEIAGDVEARLWQACAVALGAATRGQSTVALTAAATGWTALEECVAEQETALARVVLAHGELTALLVAGRIRQATTRAAQMHRWCLAQPQWAGDAVAAAQVGWVALESGRPRTAQRWLTEATAGLRRADPAGYLQFCLALLAQADAVLGEQVAARHALEGEQRPHHAGMFEPETLLAEAWVTAAEDDARQGADLALRAATVAAEMGNLAARARALHTAVRVGRADEVTAGLGELAERVEGPLVAACAAHARAVVAGAGARLDEVATEFEKLGARLLATDAAAHAATAHERAGARRQAAASTARAAGLARACETVRIPALDQLAPPPLTSREGEVAALVVQGLNNQAIAERLVLSVRTVEAHLAHVYAKLGISSRTELAGALGAGQLTDQER